MKLFRRRARDSVEPTGTTAFDKALHSIPTRPDVAEQVTRMARQYGLTNSVLSREGWMGAFLIEGCDSCPLSESCFKSKRGIFTNDLTVPAEDCPNSPVFITIAQKHKIRRGRHLWAKASPA